MSSPLNKQAPSYHVIRIQVNSEEADITIGQLYDLGCLGLEELTLDMWNEWNQPQRGVEGEALAALPMEGATRAPMIELKAYFAGDRSLIQLREEFFKSLPSTYWLEATTIGLSEMTAFPQTFEPFSLVSDIMIIPPPISTPAASTQSLAETDIIITPGLAFGSGLHDTTRLVARALWHLNPPPSSLLDVGTGSGILALLAKKMKIKDVETVEIDEEAIRNAQQNFSLNHEDDIRIFRSFTDIHKKYEVILANILSNTLLHLKPDIVAHLQSRGRLILSGITLDEADEVIDTFRDFRLLQRNDTEDWTCLTLVLPD